MELAAVATVLAAMGGVLKLVLDYLKKLDDTHEEELAKRDLAWQQALTEHREKTEVFLGNHMSSSTKALNDLVTVVESLVASVDSVAGTNGGED